MSSVAVALSSSGGGAWGRTELRREPALDGAFALAGRLRGQTAAPLYDVPVVLDLRVAGTQRCHRCGLRGRTIRRAAISIRSSSSVRRLQRALEQFKRSRAKSVDEPASPAHHCRHPVDCPVTTSSFAAFARLLRSGSVGPRRRKPVHGASGIESPALRVAATSTLDLCGRDVGSCSGRSSSRLRGLADCVPRTSSDSPDGRGRQELGQSGHFARPAPSALQPSHQRPDPATVQSPWLRDRALHTASVPME